MERKGGEDARREDVTQAFLHTDALTQNVFRHRRLYIHRFFYTKVFHTRVFTNRRLFYSTHTFSHKHSDMRCEDATCADVR